MVVRKGDSAIWAGMEWDMGTFVLPFQLRVSSSVGDLDHEPMQGCAASKKTTDGPTRSVMGMGSVHAPKQ